MRLFIHPSLSVIRSGLSMDLRLYDSSLTLWSPVLAGVDVDTTSYPLNATLRSMTKKKHALIVSVFFAWLTQDFLGIGPTKPALTWKRFADKIKTLVDPKLLIDEFLSEKSAGLANISRILVDAAQQEFRDRNLRSRLGRGLPEDRTQKVPNYHMDKTTLEAIDTLLREVLLPNLEHGNRVHGLPAVSNYHSEILVEQILRGLVRAYTNIVENEIRKANKEPLKEVPESYAKVTPAQALEFLERLEKEPRLVPYINFHAMSARRRPTVSPAEFKQPLSYTARFKPHSEVDDATEDEQQAPKIKQVQPETTKAKDMEPTDKPTHEARSPVVTGGAHAAPTIKMLEVFLHSAATLLVKAQRAMGIRGQSKRDMAAHIIEIFDTYLKNKGGIAPGLLPAIKGDVKRLTAADMVEAYQNVRGPGAQGISLAALSAASANLARWTSVVSNLLDMANEYERLANDKNLPASYDAERLRGVGAKMLDKCVDMLENPGVGLEVAERDLAGAATAIANIHREIRGEPAATAKPARQSAAPEKKPAAKPAVAKTPGEDGVAGAKPATKKKAAAKKVRQVPAAKKAKAAKTDDPKALLKKLTGYARALKKALKSKDKKALEAAIKACMEDKTDVDAGVFEGIAEQMPGWIKKAGGHRTRTSVAAALRKLLDDKPATKKKAAAKKPAAKKSSKKPSEKKAAAKKPAAKKPSKKPSEKKPAAKKPAAKKPSKKPSEKKPAAKKPAAKKSSKKK